MNQYTIEGTKTYTYYKTVYAENLVDAHIKAHEPSDDPDDDWTCHFDDDYEEPTEDNGLIIVKHIEDEGEVEDDDYDPTPQYLYDNTNGEPQVSWEERVRAESKKLRGE